jgi:AraC family transcriptional regulator
MPQRPATAASCRERVDRVSRHIAADLDADADPARLAEVACLSLHHFHRVFRGVTGESVAEHVRRLRLERAARRLRLNGTSVTQAALDAGYGSPEAFSRAFAARFGMSPSAWRDEPPTRPSAPVMPEIEIRRIPEIRVAAVRHLGPYEQVGAVYPTLIGWAMTAGVDLAAHPILGLCADDPEITAPAKLRYAACLPWDGPIAHGAPVAAETIPGGTYAVAVHVGPYDTILDTYLGLIGGWLPTTDRLAADEPCVECYLDDPRVTPPHALRTEVRIRLIDPD